MPSVETIRPLRVAAPGTSELKIAARGPNTIFYGDNAEVSSGNKIGSLASGETLTIKTKPVWLVAEASPALVDFEGKEALGSISTVQGGFKLRDFYTIKDFGAKQDGVNLDDEAYAEGFAYISARGGGELWVPQSTGTGAGERISWISKPIEIPTNCSLRGTGQGGSYIAAKAGFAGLAMIKPLKTDGTQQYMQARDLRLNCGGNAERGVYIKGLFMPTLLRGLLISQFTNEGITITQVGGGTSTPIALEKLWVQNTSGAGTGDCIKVEGAVRQLWARNLLCEPEATGTTGLHLKGETTLQYASTLSNIEVEGSKNGWIGVLIEGTRGVEGQNIVFGGGTGKAADLVRITGTSEAISLRKLHASAANLEAGGYIINDETNGVKIAPPSNNKVSNYETEAAKGPGSKSVPLIDINTAGKTTAEISAALPTGVTATADLMIADTTNKLMLFYSGTKWLKTAALTEIA